jgi:hypothetical protein
VKGEKFLFSAFVLGLPCPGVVTSLQLIRFFGESWGFREPDSICYTTRNTFVQFHVYNSVYHVTFLLPHDNQSSIVFQAQQDISSLKAQILSTQRSLSQPLCRPSSLQCPINPKHSLLSQVTERLCPSLPHCSTAQQQSLITSPS